MTPVDRTLKQSEQENASAMGARQFSPSAETANHLSEPPEKFGDETLSAAVFELPNSGSEFPEELANHPRYALVRRIGAGGMGDVYLALHRVMNRYVALKIINPGLVRDRQMVERFHREVQAAARLSHPNIVGAFDAEQAGSLHFLCMEYVDGTDLATLIRSQGPLTVAKACHFVRQAALGLQHAHEKGMVHRDIKPHNIMLTGNKQIKILDFGLARFAREEDQRSEGLTATGFYMGTADYMSPEQSQDARSADIRADIYSLGCTMYFLLTGKVPFEGGTAINKIMRHVTEKAIPIFEFRPGVPHDVVAIVERMMEKRPEDRFQTPLEVARVLEPILRSLIGDKADPGARGRDDKDKVVPAAKIESVNAARTPPPKPTMTDCLKTSIPLADSPRELSVAGKPLAQSRRVVTRVVRKKTLSRGPWGVAGAGFVLVLAGFFLRDLVRMESPKGTLEIESVEPNVRIILEKNGSLVRIVDLKSSNRIDIKEGEYSLKFADDQPTLTLSTDRFVARRGDKQIVRVNRIVNEAKTAQAIVDGSTTRRNSEPLSPAKPIADTHGASMIVLPTPSTYRNFPPGLVWSTPPGKNWWWCACFSPRGDFIAAGEDPRTGPADNIAIRVWSIKDGQMGNDSFVLRHPTDQRSWQTGMTFARDGKRLASAARDGSICIWDLDATRPTLLARIRRFDGILTALAFSPDGTHFAAGARKVGSPICVWNLSEPARPKEVYCLTPTEPEEISSLVFSADSKTLYVGTGKPNVEVRVHAWLYRSDSKATVLWSHATGAWVRTMDITCDGSLIGLTHGDQVHLIDAKTGANRMALIGHAPGQSVQGIAFSADGSRCVTAGYDGSVRAWATRDGAQIWRNEAPTGFNEGIGISPDGRLAFTSSHSGVDQAGNVAQLWRLPDPTAQPPGLELSKLTELPANAFNSGPWPSPDGLTLYWQSRVPGESQRFIWSAERPNPKSPFANCRKIAVGNDPTVSADGLEMVFLHEGVLQVATRQSKQFNFGAPRRIEEFQDLGFLAAPCLMEDGLTLYADWFTSGKIQLVCSTRTGRNAKWTRPAPILLEAPGPAALRFFFVTADKRWCFSSLPERLGDKSSNNLIVLSSHNGGRSFVAPKFIQFPSRVIQGQFPRYVFATRELFFNSFGTNPSDTQIRVLRNFDPATLTESIAAGSTQALLSREPQTRTPASRPKVLQSKTNDWNGSKFDYATYSNLSFEVGIGNEVAGCGIGEAGIEIEAVQRIAIALTKIRTLRYYDLNSFAGFVVDYHTSSGYTRRVALSTAIQSPKQQQTTPPWGKRTKPDQIHSLGQKANYDLDLSRWAPPDWDGRVWFTVRVCNSGKNTGLKARITSLQ